VRGRIIHRRYDKVVHKSTSGRSQAQASRRNVLSIGLVLPRFYSRHEKVFVGNRSGAPTVGMSEHTAPIVFGAALNIDDKLNSKSSMSDIITHNHDKDGIDRRGFLKCMAWAGTGVLWTMTGGILKSQTLSRVSDAPGAAAGADLSFVQISDSHIGFNKEANKDVAATLREAVAKINALPRTPSFMLHTGDLTHLAEAEEFDSLDQILKSCKARQVFYVPGEHDILNDNGEQYRNRFGKGSKGSGWYSFDQKGVHFIGLVNVMNIKEGGLGVLGREQLEWLEDDLKARSTSTPIVLFAHVPLWTIFPKWGWGTEDSVQALGYLKRFGSVTVLNGHIHQIIQKVEGNITFHTAMSTAFPQPEPGAAPKPGPMKVPAEKLRSVLGVTSVNYVEGRNTLAVVDSPLAG
jgi:3',5'-cyclic-AMP phosphodiesterase